MGWEGKKEKKEKKEKKANKPINYLKEEDHLFLEHLLC
jgi:hypothetical protein